MTIANNNNDDNHNQVGFHCYATTKLHDSTPYTVGNLYHNDCKAAESLISVILQVWNCVW